MSKITRALVLVLMFCLTQSSLAHATDSTDKERAAKCWARFFLDTGACYLVSNSETALCVIADMAGFPPNTTPTQADCNNNQGYLCHQAAVKKLIICLPWDVTAVVDGVEVHIEIKKSER